MLTTYVAPRVGVGAKLAVRLKSIETSDPSVKCTFNGESIGARANILLPNEESNIVCRRLPTSTNASDIHIKLSSGHYVLLYPQLPGNKRMANRNTSGVRVFGCYAYKVDPPVHFDREIIVDTIRLDGEWEKDASGEVTVLVNGRRVATSKTQADRTARFPIDATEGKALIPAFMPLVVQIDGGIDAGQCKNLSAVIRIPT